MNTHREAFAKAVKVTVMGKRCTKRNNKALLRRAVDQITCKHPKLFTAYRN